VAKQTNNIGTAYYMQVLSYSKLLNKGQRIKQIVTDRLSVLLDHQFESDGKQISELKRTRSWEYSISNLNYWFKIASISNQYGIDLWNFSTPSGKSIKSGARWLQDYSSGTKKWGYKQIDKVDYYTTFYPLERKYSKIYNNLNKRNEGNNTISASMGAKINSIKTTSLSPIVILTSGVY